MDLIIRVEYESLMDHCLAKDQVFLTDGFLSDLDLNSESLILSIPIKHHKLNLLSRTDNPSSQIPNFPVTKKSQKKFCRCCCLCMLLVRLPPQKKKFFSFLFHVKKELFMEILLLFWLLK
ncbi:hypothetical protein ACKWTF_010694 [Chironomus riparius]